MYLCSNGRLLSRSKVVTNRTPPIRLFLTVSYSPRTWWPLWLDRICSKCSANSRMLKSLWGKKLQQQQKINMINDMLIYSFKLRFMCYRYFLNSKEEIRPFFKFVLQRFIYLHIYVPLSFYLDKSEFRLKLKSRKKRHFHLN